MSSKTSFLDGGSPAADFTLPECMLTQFASHSKFVELYNHGDENISAGELPRQTSWMPRYDYVLVLLRRCWGNAL